MRLRFELDPLTQEYGVFQCKREIGALWESTARKGLWFWQQTVYPYANGHADSLENAKAAIQSYVDYTDDGADTA